MLDDDFKKVSYYALGPVRSLQQYSDVCAILMNTVFIWHD